MHSLRSTRAGVAANPVWWSGFTPMFFGCIGSEAYAFKVLRGTVPCLFAATTPSRRRSRADRARIFCGHLEGSSMSEDSAAIIPSLYTY